MYGLEALRLNKSQMSSLSFPYNSAYMKLFSTFDKSIIKQCQYYCGYLPFNFLLDVRLLSFYKRLSIQSTNPANILFNWFGSADQHSLSAKYNILSTDPPSSYAMRVWEMFKSDINFLQ